MLVSGGHSWLSIKEYSLSEIGIFVRSVVRKNTQDNANQITQQWLANNASQKELDVIIERITRTIKRKKTEVETQNEINNNWIRLASLKGR